MKRKAFNFFRSYYDVAKELNDKDRLLFYDCLIELQFNGKSKEIKGMAKFALLSQKHSIVSQIEGYNNFCKKADNEYVQIDFDYTFIGASAGGEAGASAQVEGEGKGKEQNVTTKKQLFAESLKPFLETYGKEMLNDFYLYWSETNKKGKMKFELQTTWELPLRLAKWKSQDKKFHGEKSATSKEQRERTRGLI
jgi:hypothetical protein